MSFKHRIKRIYSFLPFKRELFYLVRWFGVPPEGIFKHLYFMGTFNVCISEQCAFKLIHHGYQIENEIFWKGITGGWEKDSISFWIRLSRRSSVIFDIGANTGIFSLVSQAVNPNATVFSFEPVHRVFKKLIQNVAINRFPINCFPVAVSNCNGKAIIFDTQEDHILSVTVNKNLHPAGMDVVEKSIETITLEKFIQDHHLERIDLMKIDVETHEPEVLIGMGIYLRKFRPTLLIEILNDDVAKLVESIVAGCNYLYFNLDEKGGIMQTQHIRKSNFYNYILCSKETAKEIAII